MILTDPSCVLRILRECDIAYNFMLYSSLHIHHLRNKGTKEVGGVARRRLFHFYSAQSGHAGTVSWKTNAHRIPVSASFLPQILISPLDTFHVFSPLLSFTRCSSNSSRPASLGRDPQSQASKAKHHVPQFQTCCHYCAPLRSLGHLGRTDIPQGRGSPDVAE